MASADHHAVGRHHTVGAACAGLGGHSHRARLSQRSPRRLRRHRPSERAAKVGAADKGHSEALRRYDLA